MDNRWNELNKAQRWSIADRIKDERLEKINQNLENVVVKNTFYTKYGKRFLDIIISIFALSVTLPINLIVAIITFFDVGLPIFFKQKRVGQYGELFTIIKFRNMTNEVDNNGELLPPSQRVTKWGRFVRKTSIDELLNFLSILKGDMSLIGPRPMPMEYTDRYNKRHKARLAIKPGLECPPRKKGLDRKNWQDQLDNDVWYVENCSFKTDLLLCFRMIEFAINPEATKNRSNVSGKGSFIGYSLDGKAIGHFDVPKKYVEDELKKKE